MNSATNRKDDLIDEIAEDISDSRLIRHYGYCFLLLSICLLLLVAPILANRIDNSLLVTALIYCTFVLGLLSISSHTGHFKTILTLIALSFLFDGIAMNTDSQALDLIAFILDICLYSYIALLILNDIIIKRKDVTVDMIAGAISVYLLIGIIFAYIYILIQYLDPASFAGVKFIDMDEPSQSIPGFIYFSFVTLTTLGYGDISPNTIEAGSFVYMETIIGQVYMTVLVARLVGMHINQNRA